MLRLVALAIAAAVALCTPATASALSVINYEVDPYNGVYPDAYGFINNQGVFYVAQTCFREPSSREGVSQPPTREADGYNEIGPGYVFAAASIAQGWNTKTRDYLDLSQSDTRSGGWAKFGAHVARTKGYPDGSGSRNEFGASMKEVQGGLCVDQTQKGHRTDYGAGVSSSSATTPDPNAKPILFSVTVNLSDGLTNIFRVRYDYTVTDEVVRLRTTVTNLCSYGAGCDGGGTAGNTVYVKEPKFTVGDYRNDRPYSVMDVASVYQTGWGVTCWGYYLTDPTKPGGTVQCTDLYRQHLWMKENTDSRVSVACQWGCTWVIARAVDAFNGGLTYWAGGYGGIDRWAMIALQQSSLPNRVSAPSYCNTPKRSWELGRWSPTPDNYTATQVGFHAWTGGNGLEDCQNLFKNPGPVASYINDFEFQLPYPR